MGGTFVGRRRELADLARHFAGASAGQGAAVWLLGEAGIGKSALVEQFCRHRISPDVPVLRGRAVADLGAPAFWPWIRAFTGVTADRCGLSPELLRVDPAAHGSPAAARFSAITSSSDGLLVAARSAVLVVVLEDLQWADLGTFRMLEHLADELAGSRLLLIASARDLPPDRLTSTWPGAVIRLQPLSRAEVAAYLGDDVHPSWPAAIHRRTEGHPLYVTAVARLLDPLDLANPATSVWPVPDELTRVVMRNLSHHSAECQQLLDAASVAGTEFSLDLLDAEPQVAAEAIGSGVFVEDAASPGLLRWSHELVREARYSQLARAERIEWHRRIAERLERRGDGYAGEVAAHRLRSAVDDQSRSAAVAACAAAAEAAIADFDFLGARDWHERTLPLLDDAATQAQTLLAVADAAYRGGQVAEAVLVCEKASQTAERLDRIDLLVAAAVTVRGIGGVANDKIVALCERARAALGEERTARHARVLAQQAILLADALEIDAARPLAAEAMSLAVSGEDDEALMEAMHARHEVIGGPDGAAERMALGARMVDTASKGGRADAALWGHVWRIDAELQLGLVSELLAELFDLGALANRVGWPLMRWHLLRAQATRAIQTGRFSEAAQLAVECQQLAAKTQDTAAQVQSQLVWTELNTLTGRHGVDAASPMDWRGLMRSGCRSRTRRTAGTSCRSATSRTPSECSPACGRSWLVSQSTPGGWRRSCAPASSPLRWMTRDRHGGVRPAASVRRVFRRSGGGLPRCYPACAGHPRHRPQGPRRGGQPWEPCGADGTTGRRCALHRAGRARPCAQPARADCLPASAR